MPVRTVLALLLCCFAWGLPATGQASTGDVSIIIEGFVTSHFPEATSHFWVVNDTQWDGDEMIVDVHTVVTERRQPEPTTNRFLLLIVAGKLEGAQSIPLEAGVDCRPEEQT